MKDINGSHDSQTGQGLFLLVDRAMRSELVASTLAQRSDKWSSPSNSLLRLAKVDSRFADWPGDFVRSHDHMHTIPRYYDQHYWRINSGMLPLEVNPDIPEVEQLAVAGLVEAVLLTRVNVEFTSHTDYPCSPTPEGISVEWRAMHRELKGDPENFSGLPRTTWNGLIHQLIDGQVRVGYDD